MARSASAATAGWARALINSRVEAYADYVEMTQATALGGTTLTEPQSAQRAFAPRGVEKARHGTTWHNELLNHLEMRETLIGITSAQRALALRGVEKALTVSRDTTSVHPTFDSFLRGSRAFFWRSTRKSSL